MECLSKLNSLQSNAKTLELLKHSGNLMNSTSIQEMNQFCGRVLNTDQLQSLNMVHVAGTKGKGSTAAFIESLFRKHGLKTGLFTSPHLRHVNERIRLNGKALSDAEFEMNFKSVWESLEHTGETKPSYFRFLTLMGFYTFIKEQVDICVVEVGVGGRYDGTNVIKSPLACVITPIGMDHVVTLGDTIAKIAHHKAGIIKRNAAVFSSEQFEESFREIEQECKDKQATLIKCPNTHEILNKCDIELHHQLQNATTAIYTFEHVMKTLNKPIKEQLVIEAINSTRWPGRNQIVPIGSLNYFLDGAHTVESLSYCTDWFSDCSQRSKILIFNCTPERLNATMMSLLQSITWKQVIFTNNKTYKTGYTNDLLNKTISYQVDHFDKLQLYIPNSVVTTSIEAAIELVNQHSDCDVLCTGSLHLIGGIMEFLDIPID